MKKKTQIKDATVYPLSDNKLRRSLGAGNSQRMPLLWEDGYNARDCPAGPPLGWAKVLRPLCNDEE